MNARWIRRAVPIVLAVAAGACGPRVSDTGYVGLWQREAQTGPSRIAIWRVGDEYRFASIVEGKDRKVDCDEHGDCDEIVDGQLIYRWHYRAFLGDGDDTLYVECRGEPAIEGNTPLTYVDRLELQPGGLELHSFTVQRNRFKLPRPGGPYVFVKVSDRPGPFG